MRTITGLFDSRAEAERAVETLVQHLGYERERIQVQAAGAENVSAHTTDRRSEDHHGFRSEGGGAGILVTLLVPEEKAEEALQALRENGSKGGDPQA
ncbi:hypothetical protein JMJ55_02540 [Belnapia sp. T6]|uniref:Uncharacterized protein n=1 Tax=Belnapia mucosa TaxID=2804532 RepID=A0ABS1UXI6_9PROT|nr:hypothetical protein [Belnapia mucosa]MBL6454184.1 hypothetical protein [Belnapia mucosa]